MEERLLLNVLLSMAPVFIYQAMIFSGSLDRDSKTARTIMGFVSGLASALCMMFPVVFGAHFLWDLRWVPFLLAIIYGGLEGGTVCSIIILAYRAFLGGFLSWLIVAVDALVLLVLLLLYRRFLFKTARGTGRLIVMNTIVSSSAYVYVMSSIFLYFVIQHKTAFFLGQGFIFFLAYGVITVTAHNLSVLLIENLFNQAAIRTDLQQAEKLHLVSDLAASFAHEIRNPLTVAKGILQLMSESIKENTVRHIHLAQSELDRAEGIISDYLNFAKPQSEKTEPVLISDEILEVIRVMSPFAAMHSVTISGDAVSKMYVLCDKKKLKQVIVNLFKNAIEAIPNGGHVTIATTNRQDTVVITIQDNGVGMGKDQLALLGKPFYSTKTKGTGLGLMVTFRLVEVMGGKLQFTSKQGHGTTATILLPLVSQM